MYIENREWTAREIASRIAHTVLAPDATREMIEKACALARTYRFKAVFTNPYWSPFVAEQLEGSGVAAAFPRPSLWARCPPRARWPRPWMRWSG
jgi:deoxyribose-phosphate aldolase